MYKPKKPSAKKPLYIENTETALQSITPAEIDVAKQILQTTEPSIDPNTPQWLQEMYAKMKKKGHAKDCTCKACKAC